MGYGQDGFIRSSRCDEIPHGFSKESLNNIRSKRSQRIILPRLVKIFWLKQLSKTNRICLANTSSKRHVFRPSRSRGVERHQTLPREVDLRRVYTSYLSQQETSTRL